MRKRIETAVEQAAGLAARGRVAAALHRVQEARRWAAALAPTGQAPDGVEGLDRPGGAAGPDHPGAAGVAGPDGPDAWRVVLARLAWFEGYLTVRSGWWAEGAALCREAEAVLGPAEAGRPAPNGRAGAAGHPDPVDDPAARATVLVAAGRLPDAERAAGEAVRRARAETADDRGGDARAGTPGVGRRGGNRERPRQALRATGRWCALLLETGHPRLAEEEYARGWEEARRAYGPGHPLTLELRAGHARALVARGWREEGVRELRAVLRIGGRGLPGLRTDLTDHQLTLAATLAEQDEYAVAAELLRELPPRLTERPDPSSPDPLARGVHLLAEVRRGQRRYGEAVELADAVLRHRARRLGEAHPYTALTRLVQAGALVGVGRPGEAVWGAARAVADLTHALAPEHPWVQDGTVVLARALLGDGRVEQGTAELEGVVRALERHAGARHPRTLRARRALEEALVATGARAGRGLAREAG
ncbi:tetratricopeptide repeat protein [Allostreptomyces psammosilenae]|uniref:Tetratricopeptide repeat protein n=1 Tax=Allostreptomyces psammosilenae TaxID=1892865 RepID=A0A853A033_9ACTN|nr:tetratricopeptide repeat protein [Allostreptomyces psammosilenae]NYI07467.1 hypothetical protein [Allostreptomyces psammosilenae]